MFSADGNLSVFWFLPIFLFKMCIYNCYHWEHVSQHPQIFAVLWNLCNITALHEVCVMVSWRPNVNSALISAHLPGKRGPLYSPCWPAVWSSVKNSAREKETLKVPVMVSQAIVWPLHQMRRVCWPHRLSQLQPPLPILAPKEAGKQVSQGSWDPHSASRQSYPSSPPRPSPGPV